ncbi:MAG: RIP metalloprotease RseP [Micavibrio aeruginosavorus]|nr:RIP metalloprotease RseP [Micavibrio aeruginosavorus]
MPGFQDLLHLVTTNMWVYGGSFLLVLSILVFVHEMGHYLVARWCGVRIDSFSIGFGREIWGFTDRHGTRWKFSLIPLGGYVKMFGDVDPASAKQSETVGAGDAARPMTAEERKGAFFAKNVWQRMAIVFAGPGINYLFAILILTGLYVFYGQPVTPPQASAIVAGSAAEKAGFQPHDVITEIEGRSIARFEDVRREVAVKLDTPTVFQIKRGDQAVTLTAEPLRLESEDEHGFKQSRGFLGIVSPGNAIDIKHIKVIDGVAVKDADQARELLLSRMDQTFVVELDRGEGAEAEAQNRILIHPLAANNADMKDSVAPNFNALVISESQEEAVIKHGPIDGLGQAIRETWNITVSTLEAIGQMFNGTRSAQELGGIIRIGAIAGDMAQAGVIALITFTALLSINLGLINLFPVPMLDGGHLLFYVIEAIRRKPLSEQIQEYAFRLGLAILVGIMVFANLNDIMQLIL